MVTESPDAALNAATIAAMAFFGTASDALEPSVVDFELADPDFEPLAPVQADSSGTAPMPATPAAIPFSMVRRLVTRPGTDGRWFCGAGNSGMGTPPQLTCRCDLHRFRSEALIIDQK